MLVNLTPHPIKIVVHGGEIEVQPSGILVRLKPHEEIIGGIEATDGKGKILIPVEKVEYKGITFLKDGKEIPQEEAIENIRKGVDTAEAVYVIVPQLISPVAEELAKLLAPAFILAPNTNKAIRDEKGRVVGVKSLILLAKT